jgi:hypothetical protein
MTLENEGLRHTSGVLAENNRARELDLKERAAAIENYRAAKADGVTGTRLQVLFEKAYGADEAKPATPEPARARNWKGGKTRVF